MKQASARTMQGTRKVAVYSRAGAKLGEVPERATSVGASRVAGGPCELSKRFGCWAWVRKDAA